VVSVFAQFAPRLQEAIVARLGWTSLRPVQELAGEALLAGKNAVVLAPTAGGKTEASMFPTLSNMVTNQPDGVGAIYVAPIKALLNNQAERLGNYTEMVGLQRFVWHGDTNSHERKTFLKDPCELLMTTPESLEVMLVSQSVDATKLFRDLRIIVIDEVHAIAGSDRGAHLMSVIERLQQISEHDIQRVGLSATVGNPEQILRWLQGSSQRAGCVVDPPKKASRRQLLITHRADISALAFDAARISQGEKSLFFCQSRSLSESVAEFMRRAGTSVFVHHSAVSREERQLAELEFHRGSNACIVCTSTLELGIDVGDLDKVLQAEAPDSVGSFLQRMGRTGRRDGQAANMTFFCSTADSVLQAIALIELAKEHWVENVSINDRCWPVLIHQLLAMSLASDGISPVDAWNHLSIVPDFRGISREEFDALIQWLIEDNSLILTSGVLILGPQAERRFGRRNFMELYAVFSSPQSYNVHTRDGRPLGTLNQDFVDGLVDGVSCFLLGGRAWAVSFVDHNERVVKVESAPRGRQPTWGGFLPQFLGFDLCQKILDVLCAEDSYPYLDRDAATQLDNRRQQIQGIVQPRVGGIDYINNEIHWHTFAGGRINSTLRYALASIGGDWKILPDNFRIRITADNLAPAEFHLALEEIRRPDFWDNEDLWQQIADGLPNYRLSKFQPLMPDWIQREMVGDFLLDVRGARRWIQSID